MAANNRYPVWTKYDEDLLVQSKDLPWEKLFDLFPNRSKVALLLKLHKLGHKKPQTNFRKYTFNDAFFGNTSLESAYWAGFIAADGNIYIQECKYPKLQIQVQNRDREILEQFSVAVDYTGNLVEQSQRNAIGIYLNSCYGMAKDLERIYNIVPKKSLVAIPPNITDPELIKAFIVGYIDGDGSISVTTKKDFRQKNTYIYQITTLSIAGTQEMLSWIGDFFYSICGKRNKVNISTGSRIYQYQISGNKAEHILQDLYKVPIWKLPRKWERSFICGT